MSQQIKFQYSGLLDPPKDDFVINLPKVSNEIGFELFKKVSGNFVSSFHPLYGLYAVSKR